MGWKDKIKGAHEAIEKRGRTDKEYNQELSERESTKKENEYWHKQREVHGTETKGERIKSGAKATYGFIKKHTAEGPKHKARREELEKIRGEARTKAYKETEESGYRKRGKREGRREALGHTGFAWNLSSESTKFAKHIPMMGYSDKHSNRIAANINANPLMRDIFGPVHIPKAKGQSKSNKSGRPIVKVYIGNKKQGRRQKKKRKQRNQNFWNVGPLF